MIRKFFTAGLATLMLGAGLMTAAPQAAQAGGITLQGPNGSIHIGERHHKPQRYYRNLRICSPGEAVHKARSQGVRHAHVDRVGNRFVVVSGRKHGHGILMGIERRSRHCNIAWVKGGHGRRY
ncbi:MAG: hypothetical protein KDJ80_15410 [Nitratireductor sp.]|nr:hypothetical protein [Nitratireductor sp.]